MADTADGKKKEKQEVIPQGRFYEDEFPKVDEFVMVQVRRIVDSGAYCSLLEYGGKEGMLLQTELSKRRIRSVAKLLRVGRTEVCMILRQDVEKGYIDLSKRRVENSDATETEERFAKAKTVHGIMCHVAAAVDVPVEELCSKVSWPMHKQYKDAFEAFKRHINDDEFDLWKDLDFSQPGMDLSDKAEEIKALIDENLKRKLIQQTMRLRAKIDVSCNEYEGIDAVKNALQKGLEIRKDDCEIKINLVAHPTFVLTCTCREKTKGIEALNELMEAVKTSIVSQKGQFSVRSEPSAIGKTDPDEKEGGSGSDTDDDKSEEDVEGMGDLDEEQMKKLAEMKVDDDDDDGKD